MTIFVKRIRTKLTCAKWAVIHRNNDLDCCYSIATHPRQQFSWGPYGAHLGPVGPRWAPCWPHEPCYQGRFMALVDIFSCFVMLDDVMIFKGDDRFAKTKTLISTSCFQEPLRYQQFQMLLASNYINGGNIGIGFTGISPSKSDTVAHKEVVRCRRFLRYWLFICEIALAEASNCDFLCFRCCYRQ